jgi:hypothetical protein
MTEEWINKQRTALIAAGVAPVDAISAVQAIVDQIPDSADLDRWMPRSAPLDNTSSVAMADALSYWITDIDLPDRWRMIQSATPVKDEEIAKQIKIASGIAILYFFLINQGRYYTQHPFRPVSQEALRDLLDGLVLREELAIVDLIEALHAGKIAPAVFQQRMQVQLRRLHINYRSLGAGGYRNLSPGDLRKIGATLQYEFDRLASFIQQIINGQSTLRQSQVRAQMYIGTARIQYWQAVSEHLQAPPGMVVIKRRMLNPADHCRDCVSYADRGWTLPNDTPSPGIGSACRSNCKCYEIYKTVPVNELALWLGSKQ